MIPRLATSFRTDCARYDVRTGAPSDAQRIDRARARAMRAASSAVAIVKGRAGASKVLRIATMTGELHKPRAKRGAK